ncbi:PIN/TRAM domain-containing protein [Hathewaya histolytica]|uniref:Membrane-associated protein n=1 Tax=Hathewaya histolytica TaxID=1498 RepID=A0A4U9RTY3_HATHI|nr:PIN/TRAM domain-containing protein [Hathewaya histolytica]VTQ95211.1 Membrane-associated protein [Hathewaya histolytica]
MLKKILKVLFTLTGGVTGYILSEQILKMELINKNNTLLFITNNMAYKVIFMILLSLAFAFILFLFSPIIINYIISGIEYVERILQKRPAGEILFGTAGAIIGLIISTLFLNQLKTESILWTFLTIIITVIVVVICTDIAVRKREDIYSFFVSLKKTSSSIKDKKSKNKGTSKVLDTSVIIDGRILDICQTGFVEGVLIVPEFVLEELRHIADSSDDLKRTRGRRGLDILNKMQTELKLPLEISETDFKDVKEVDSKLLKLAQSLNGKVITNDYNLNKVAKFQGVEVLNINELANAIKPIVLPGEEMKIQVVKDGKESGQGIGYLDDGTMIVVEGAKKHIGEFMDVQVTSVLQTAAGRMIFAKRKNN